MPVELSVPPQVSIETLRAAVSRRTRRIGSTPDTMAEQYSHALPVFDFGVKDIVDGNGTDVANQVGWRYLFFTHNEPVMGAEVNYTSGPETHTFSHFNQGPFNAGTLAALEIARTRREVTNATYYLAALRVAALGLFAIWLRHASGGTDLLIPVPLAPSVLKAGHCYLPSALFEQLRESARRAIEFAARPKPR